jgi:hypothetical protein
VCRAYYTGSGSVEFYCNAGASCEFVNASTGQTFYYCSSGAYCLHRKTHSGNFTFNCPETVVSCGGGVYACQRACP